jgi:integrase
MRERKFWTKPGRPYYYTKVDGRPVRLDLITKGENASRRKLEQVLKDKASGPAARGVTFARLADRFLAASEADNAGETYLVHRYVLQSFKDFVGKRTVANLCEDDLDCWCRKMAQGGRKVDAGGRQQEGVPRRFREGAGWSENTQARGKAVVLAALNFGVKKLGMPPHPLAHVKPGTVDRREKTLTKGERERLKAVTGPFADYLTALELTGARPFSEVAKITAADVDLDKGTWTLRKWKNSKKKKGTPGAKRTIYLVPAMLEMTRRLVKEHPEGPLFRNSLGKPYSRQTITARFRRLGERLGIEGLTAYCLRHCYVSDALLHGVPAAMVAELCGTSIQTIEKHYRHLDVKHDALREAAVRAIGG